MEKFDKTNPYNPKTEKPNAKKPAIAVALFLLIAIFLIIKCGCGNNDDEVADKSKKYDKLEALAQAQVFVESKLKAPASAKFGGGQEGVTKINDTIFTVVGTVDSQNSFGAMLRSNYSCKVIFHPQKDTHDIENFIMQ